MVNWEDIPDDDNDPVTDPWKGDGINDNTTDPSDPDCDRDGMYDGWEFYYSDTDGDGLPDGWEQLFNFSTPIFRMLFSYTRNRGKTLADFLWKPIKPRHLKALLFRRLLFKIIAPIHRKAYCGGCIIKSTSRREN